MVDNISAFLVLIRAGLWEKGVLLLPYGKVDYEEVMRLAEEQSVVGLVTAGLEHVKDVKVPQEILLLFIGQALQLEQQNKVMNEFVAHLIEQLRNADIYTLLVKGQGVSQCYERPLWRVCGDVDLFLSEENYKKAKALLLPKATIIQEEWGRTQHLGMSIESWVVELHGSLCGSLSHRINRELDDIKRDTFYGVNVRSWNNDGTSVFLLACENDIIYVFTHFLNHFYKGGIGLRQICDWCRLLWTYREEIDNALLEKRLRKMGVMSEWKAFGAFAVDYLGMPEDKMPFYSSEMKWKKKAEKILSFIMEVGNFGHNRDMSYYNSKPYLVRKVISFGRRCKDFVRHVGIFPLDSIRFFPYIIYNGMRDAMRGEG